jgi:hypothetical protein
MSKQDAPMGTGRVGVLTLHELVFTLLRFVRVTGGIPSVFPYPRPLLLVGILPSSDPTP